MKLKMNKKKKKKKKGMTSVSVPAEYSVRSWIPIRRKECHHSQCVFEGMLFF